MPRIGVAGKSGARNGRSAFGCVRLITSTAAQTMTKASSVPMLARSARISSGRKPPIAATTTPVRIVVFHGVRNLGWTAPKNDGGSRRSRAMARSTRGWLSIITSSTEVMPARAPSEIRNCAHGSPAWRNAAETGAWTSIWP